MEVTKSSIKTYLDCPRKYHYAYQLLIKPKKKSIHLSNGTAIHDALLKYYTVGEKEENCPIPGGSSKFVVWGMNENFLHILYDIAEGKDFDKNTAMLMGMIGGYTNVYSHKEFQTYDGEKKFSVKYGEDKVDGVKDSIVSDYDGNAFLMEYKSTAETFETIKERVDFDIEPMIYLWAHYIEKGEMLDGVLYRFLKKTQLREKQLESHEAYCDRIMKDYFMFPEKYFAHLKVYKNEDDLKWFQDELTEYIEDMKRVRKLWPRNTQRCFDYGGCSFYALCQNQEVDRALVEKYYEHKNKQHEEVV